MRSNEFYYLVMVCGTFVVFAISLAASYIQYRRWLRQPVHHRKNRVASPISSGAVISGSSSSPVPHHAALRSPE